jgi:hypothetical protein
VTTSQLVEQDAALRGHHTAADRCRLTGTAEQPFPNVAYHIGWRALVG